MLDTIHILLTKLDQLAAHSKANRKTITTLTTIHTHLKEDPEGRGPRKFGYLKSRTFLSEI